MEINAQIIKKANKSEFAVVPYKQFLRMKEIIEDYEDLIELRKAKDEDKNSKGKVATTVLNELNQ